MASTDSGELTQAWRAAQARLPEGWVLDGLRCASSGLAVEQRSDAWVAVAVGPSGEERTFQSDDPLGALAGLVGSFEAD